MSEGTSPPNEAVAPSLCIEDENDPFANIAPLDTTMPAPRRRVQIEDGVLGAARSAPGGRAGRKRMSVVDALTREHRRPSEDDEDEDLPFAAKGKRRASLADAVQLLSENSMTVLLEKKASIDMSTIGRAEFANIQRMFEINDTDGSGTIDPKELRSVMLSLGHQLTDEQLGNLIYEITGDKLCDALDFEDFVKLILFWKDAARFRLFERETAPQRQHIEAASATLGNFLPDNVFRRFWDVLMLCCLVFLWGTVTFYYCIVGDDTAIDRYQRYLTPMETIVSVLFVLDACLGMKTVYLDGRHVVVDGGLIRRRYARTWLAIDVISTLPYWLFIPSPAAGYVNWIRVVRFLKLRSLFSVSGRVPMDPSFVMFYYQVLPLIQSVAVFFCVVHTAAVIMIYQQPERALSLSYGTGIYWAMLILSSVGLDVVKGTNDTIGKKWYSMVVMLCGQMLNAVAVGNLVQYFQIADISAVRAGKLAETAAVCQFFDIPEALGNEILQFQDHVLQHNLSVAYFNLIKGLPNEMKVHIGIYARIRLIHQHPIFALGHEAVRVAVAQALDAVVYTPEEYVIIAEDVDTDMFVVAHGFLDVLSKRSGYVLTLRQGDHFGEMSLFREHNHSVSVKTLTYCELFALSGAAFDSLMERFPTFRRDVDRLLERMDSGEADNEIVGCRGADFTSELSDLSFLNRERYDRATQGRDHAASMEMERSTAEQSQGLLAPSSRPSLNSSRRLWNATNSPATPKQRRRTEDKPAVVDNYDNVPNVGDVSFRREGSMGSSTMQPISIKQSPTKSSRTSTTAIGAAGDDALGPSMMLPAAAAKQSPPKPSRISTTAIGAAGDDALGPSMMLPAAAAKQSPPKPGRTSTIVTGTAADDAMGPPPRPPPRVSPRAEDSTEADALGRTFKKKGLEERKRQAKENDVMALAQHDLRRQHRLSASGSMHGGRGSVDGDVLHVLSPTGSFATPRAGDAGPTPTALENATVDNLIRELQAQLQELCELVASIPPRTAGPSLSASRQLDDAPSPIFVV
jgi:hypothetical protein